jgi:hypothetical protein
MNSRARRDERRRRAPTPKNDNEAMVPPPFTIEKQRIQDPTERLIHDLKERIHVFVQGLPVEATWKDLKDHFKRSLPNVEVVFASVSIDKQTGKSKQCGIVQFETPNLD